VENPVVFMSYSRDSEEYSKWVRSFADRLIRDGVDARIDQYDLNLGQPLPHFMEHGISESDYVLVLITKGFIEKAKARKGGVGYEVDLSTGEILVKGKRSKFIPVLVEVDFNQVPDFLLGRYAIRIANTQSYDTPYRELYAHLTNQKPLKPRLGKIVPLELLRGEDELFDVEAQLKSSGMPNYEIWNFLIIAHDYKGYSISELYPEYQKALYRKKECFVERVLPNVMQFKMKTITGDRIRFESGDYRATSSNVFCYDRLELQDNMFKYSMFHSTDNKPLQMNTWLPCLSIMAIIHMLRKLAIGPKDKTTCSFSVSIKSNEQAVFSQLFALFIPNAMNFSLYQLRENAVAIELDSINLEIDSIHKLISRILGCFVAVNENVAHPFLSIEKNQVKDVLNKLEKGEM